MSTTEARNGPQSGANSWLIASVATLATWTYSFTWNTVSVALPHMQGTFSATNDQIAWVMISFIVGSAMMTASIGWLSARFGRRQLFLFAVAGFTISLVGCGFSTSLTEQVVWRFVQGVCGAPLIALGQIIAVNAFPPERYSLATSFWALGFVTGNVVAPAIGGIIIEYYAWPWIFYVNLPLCCLVFVAALVLIPETEKSREKLDWLGFITLILGIAALQYTLARGERLDWFSSGEIVFFSIASCTLLYIYIAHTITGTNTFFDKALFRNFNFSIGQVVIFVIGAAIYMPLLLLPLMLQQIAGYPPLETGQLLLARGAGSVIGLVAMSQLRERWDPRPLMVFGLVCNIIPAWQMAHWTAEVIAFEVQWTNFLAGLGVGFVWAPLNRMVLSRLKGKLQDQGFAMFYLNFDLGYAIGTTAIVGLHARYTQINYSLLNENISPFNEFLQRAPPGENWSIADNEGLLSLQAEISRQAATIAYNNSFMICAILMIMLIPLVFVFRKDWGQDS